MADPREIQLHPGWLLRQLRSAEAEVRSWPAWMRGDMMTKTATDVTDLKIELAALKRELRLEDEEHSRTVALINKDIKRTEKLIRQADKGR